MAPLLIQFLNLLVLGTVATAAPANQVLSVAPHSQLQPTTTQLSDAPTATSTATLAASPSSTAALTISLDLINSAPIQNNPTGDNSGGSIPGGTDNSTLTNVRPDLQTYVDTTTPVVTSNGTSKAKRTLGQDTPNPGDCAGSQDISLAFAQTTWNAVAVRICKTWYPDPSAFEYDPSAPWPSSLKSSKLGPFSIGKGLPPVSFQLAYGVNDWGTQAAYGWQTYYVPQSQSICIADLTILINDMFDACFFPTGYDTSSDIVGTRNPKWYTFTVTSP